MLLTLICDSCRVCGHGRQPQEHRSPLRLQPSDDPGHRSTPRFWASSHFPGSQGRDPTERCRLVGLRRPGSRRLPRPKRRQRQGERSSHPAASKSNHRDRRRPLLRSRSGRTAPPLAPGRRGCCGVKRSRAALAGILAAADRNACATGQSKQLMQSSSSGICSRFRPLCRPR